MRNRLKGRRFKNDWTMDELDDIYSDIEMAVTVPVNVKIEAEHRVLDLSRMEEVLRDAELIVLQDCGCKTIRGNCDAPGGTCISLDASAKDTLRDPRHNPRVVTLDEALEALRVSHEAGLVHLAYTMEGEEYPSPICSCCPCCCHTLSGLLRLGLAPVVLTSGKIAIDDSKRCTNCGTCVSRCVFRARRMWDGVMTYDPTKCFGCGLCVSTCPANAITLANKV
jgi:NAD-dependent dihydropyrimidine dehydrogenase PreA subunit